MFNDVIILIFLQIDACLILGLTICYIAESGFTPNRRCKIIGSVLTVALVCALIVTGLLCVCVDKTSEENVEIDNITLFVLTSPVEVNCDNPIFNNTVYVGKTLVYNYYFINEPLWYSNTQSYLVHYGDSKTVTRLGVFSNYPVYTNERYVLKLFNGDNFTEIDVDSLDFDTLSNYFKFALSMRNVTLL